MRKVWKKQRRVFSARECGCTRDDTRLASLLHLHLVQEPEMLRVAVVLVCSPVACLALDRAIPCGLAARADLLGGLAADTASVQREHLAVARRCGGHEKGDAMWKKGGKRERKRKKTK